MVGTTKRRSRRWGRRQRCRRCHQRPFLIAEHEWANCFICKSWPFCTILPLRPPFSSHQLCIARTYFIHLLFLCSNFRYHFCLFLFSFVNFFVARFSSFGSVSILYSTFSVQNLRLLPDAILFRHWRKLMRPICLLIQPTSSFSTWTLIRCGWGIQLTQSRINEMRYSQLSSRIESMRHGESPIIGSSSQFASKDLKVS